MNGQKQQDIRRGWTSASNAMADSLCQGRFLAQAGIPEPVKDPDAVSGTRIHVALALQNPEGLTLPEREMYQSCSEIERKIVVGFFGGDQKPVAMRHRRFWCRISMQDKRVLEHSGEADVIYRAGTKALVIDYKTLLGDHPDSPKNLQLRDLAVLARGELQPISEVGAVIIQPLVTHSPEVCLYQTQDLDRAMHEMFIRVANSHNPNAERTAGEPQCTFCLAKLGCVTYQKWAGAVTPPAMLSVLGVPMDRWTPEQRAVAANAIGPAQDFIEHLKDFLKHGLNSDPNFVPGWTLKPGVKRESISNPQECHSRFLALGGTTEQFMKSISVGKNKLKEVMAEVTGANGMALDKAMKTITDGIVETSTTSPSLKKVGE